MTVRKIILILSFFFFLHPISVDGLSVNYSFLVFPLGYILMDGKVRRPQKLFLLLIGLFTLIFIIASMYQYEFFDEGLRRAISFVLFMSMFSFMVVKIDATMIESFKVSIVAIGLYFSLHSMYSFILLGGSSLGFGAKDLVGGQRFGFIYLLGIWLTYLYQGHEKLYVLIKYPALLILLVGSFLTFSRASVIGLSGSFVFFGLVNGLTWLRKPNLKIFLKGLYSIVSVGILIVLLFQLVPITFTFFQERLISYLMDSSAIMADLTNHESSGGTRVYIVGRILDYLMHYPLTGSGYLGVWILSDDLFGSAHNQYTDVLFRTGLIGFSAFMYLLYLLAKYLYANDRALFWGFVGVLLYGMFHETFKESQGGFVLAFLLGMMSQTFLKAKHEVVPKDVIAAGAFRNRKGD